MPQVLNKKRSGIPPGAVYVGRPSKWGNPFAMHDESERARVIAQYRAHLAAHPELVAQAKRELRGKDLVCWCAPRACHADVLLEVANGDAPPPAPDPFRL